MDREEIALRDRLKNILNVYTLEEIFENNDATVEDILVFLVHNYGLLLPDYEPL